MLNIHVLFLSLFLSLSLFHLLGQSWIDQFSVGSTSGVVSVVGTLDREAQSRYVVGIRVMKTDAVWTKY